MSRKEFKLKILQRFEDALEVRLAGVKAAKAKLEEQINRDEYLQLENLLLIDQEPLLRIETFYHLLVLSSH